MPRSGGVYSLPTSSWYPAVADTEIDPDDSNSTLADIAQGLTDSVARDGSAEMTGNLPMASHKVTGLAAATTAGDAVRYEQVLPSVFQPLDADLTAIAALGYTTGSYLIKKTAADTWSLVDEAGYVHTTGAETVAGVKTLTSAPVINLNGGTLPSAPTGTVLYGSNVDNTNARLELVTYGSGVGILGFRRAKGTNASPSAIQSGDILGQFQADGYGATTFGSGSAWTVRATASENWTDSAKGAYGSLMARVKGTAGGVTENYRFGDFTSALELGYRDGGAGSVPDATYTFALTDRGTPTDHSSGSGHTYTVPPASSVAMPANAILYGTNFGAGTLTIARGSGVTFRDAAGTNADLSIAQYQSYSLRRHPTTADTWTVRTA